MTLNGQYSFHCTENAFFGAHHKNLNEGRLILPAAKMEANSVVNFTANFQMEHLPTAGVPNESGVGKICNFHFSANKTSSYVSNSARQVSINVISNACYKLTA